MTLKVIWRQQFYYFQFRLGILLLNIKLSTKMYQIIVRQGHDLQLKWFWVGVHLMKNGPCLVYGHKKNQEKIYKSVKGVSTSMPIFKKFFQAVIKIEKKLSELRPRILADVG